ncbi:MAG: ABC transporter ATP-binding protein/permease [Alphaproteobacteria bacterium]
MRTQGQVLRQLLPWLWPAGRGDLKLRVILALCSLVVAKLFAVTAPFLYKAATDNLAAEPDALGAGWQLPQWLLVPIALVVAYGVMRIAMQGFAQLRDGLFAKVGNHAQKEIAVATFRHLHALSLQFHLNRRTGGMARVIDRGVKGIDFLLRFSLFSVIPTLIEIVMVGAIFWVKFGPLFAVVTVVTVAAYVWFTFRLTEWRVGIRRRMNDSDNDANVKAVDSLLNFETVKYFNNEDHETGRYRKSMTRYSDAAVRSQTSLALLNTGQVVVTSVGLMALMGLTAQGVMTGDYTIGDFVLVNAFLIQLFVPLGLLGTVYREIKQSLTDMEELFGLMARNKDVLDSPNAQPLVIKGGAIKFDHVNFAYSSDRPILHDVNFEVAAGHTLALVGPSGAGKSTISRLLFRFYDVTQGAITIDGQDLRDVTQDSLRQAIGIVPQDTVLFNDTIGYNIRYGNPAAAEGEIAHAANLASIDRFIAELPDGYDSMVGERGLKLSGGEKQRVAIARTLLKDPPILILDEATSALDTATERDIQGALDRVSENRTALIIAHRLSTVIHADKIIVLEKGRIVETGTHDELLAENGLYAHMWQSQQRNDGPSLGRTAVN